MELPKKINWSTIGLLIVLLIGVVFFLASSSSQDSGYDTSDGKPHDITINMKMENSEYDRFANEYEKRTGHAMDEDSINDAISEEEGAYSAQHLPNANGIYSIQYLSWTVCGTVDSKIRLAYRPYGLLTIRDKDNNKILVYVLGASSITTKGDWVKVTGIVLGTIRREGKVPVMISTHDHINVEPDKSKDPSKTTSTNP